VIVWEKFLVDRLCLQNDYVGWGKILSQLAGKYPAVKAAVIDE